MKKILQSATLSLCISMPYAHAAPSPLSLVITTSAPSISTSIDLNNPFNTEAVLRLYQNAPFVIGGVFVGFMGLDMVRQSIQRMVDKGLEIETSDQVSYSKLIAKTVLGASLLSAAGWGIRTLLK
jgi:hypothetical protein